MGDKLTAPPANWYGWGLLKEPTSEVTTLDQLRDPIRKVVEELDWGHVRLHRMDPGVA